MKLLLASATVALTGLSSCKKEATGSETSSGFLYQLQTVNRTAPVARMAATSRMEGASVQWTSGIASAIELKFEAESSKGEVEFKQKTAQQIDLFAATSSLGNITIPEGTYQEVEFKAHLSPAGSTPALQLNGSFMSGSVTKAIQFVVNTNVELKAEKHNVVVAQGATYAALNSIDLIQISQGLTEAALNSAQTNSNNTIVISATTNTNLYNMLVTNLNNHHCEAEVEKKHD